MFCLQNHPKYAPIYLNLPEQNDSGPARLRMLNQKRSATLDEIHFRERQLERLDYLRHELRKKTEGQKE